MVITRSQTKVNKTSHQTKVNKNSHPKVLNTCITKYMPEFPPFCPQEDWDTYKIMNCGHQCALVTLDYCCVCILRGKNVRYPKYCSYCK